LIKTNGRKKGSSNPIRVYTCSRHVAVDQLNKLKKNKMANSKIIVSNPCNKDWSKMSSTENGKHCISCNKTVVDFANWELDDIKQYLKQSNENVCGHFKSLQVIVKRPRHHQFLVDVYFKTETNFKSSYFKSFILSSIITVMFLVGCNNPTKTENQIDIKDSIKTDEHEGRTLGEVAPQDFEHNDSLQTIQRLNNK
jgi:hypothetical protein